MTTNSKINIGKIKLLVLDVDGTLTDGKIYMGNEGELFKAFNVKDGSGIHDILPKMGIRPVIITARKSDIVEYRCRELDINMVFQGVRNKREMLYHICHEEGFIANESGEFNEVAFMGDDVVDLPIMQAAILKACPADASRPILNLANFVSTKNGGEGAVRELIDYLYANRGKDIRV